jgi:hypothetical protein
MPFRQVVRDDAEEIWRQQIQTLITQAPYNTLSFFQLLSKILRVSFINQFYKNQSYTKGNLFIQLIK